MKKVLTVLLFSISLLLSGCGDSEGESKLETQQMLDSANYAGVIAKLEGGASSTSDFIALGAAYMGKAGLSLADIVSAMSSDDSNGDDGFGTFVSSIADKSTSTALSDLGKANDNYKQILGDKCRDENITLSDSQQDICLYIALANTTKAAVVIDTIAQDVSALSSDNNSSDDKLTASSCAMQYAFDGGSIVNVDGNCTIVEDGNVTFSLLEKTYTKLTVDVNSTSYYYLMSDANQTILTDGFCSADSFTPRVDDYNVTTIPTQHACPINEDKDAEELTTAGTLVNVLNNGIGSMGGASSSDDIQSDIDEFKCDILDGNYNEFSGCNVDITQEITEEEMIAYLNRENG